MTDRRADIIDRIRSRTIVAHTGFSLHGKASACHLWTGPDSGAGRGGGYGRMSLSGQTVAVHLVVYSHFFGYIPGKKQIDHKCNVRRCCNPDHLQMVTHKTNQKLRAQRAKD